MTHNAVSWHSEQRRESMAQATIKLVTPTLYSCQGSTELERLCNQVVMAYWRYYFRVTCVATHRTCETVAISSVSAGDATAWTANETKSQTLLCQYIQTTLSRFHWAAYVAPTALAMKSTVDGVVTSHSSDITTRSFRWTHMQETRREWLQLSLLKAWNSGYMMPWNARLYVNRIVEQPSQQWQHKHIHWWSHLHARLLCAPRHQSTHMRSQTLLQPQIPQKWVCFILLLPLCCFKFVPAMFMPESFYEQKLVSGPLPKKKKKKNMFLIQNCDNTQTWLSCE
jgi:hypothetical protein